MSGKRCKALRREFRVRKQAEIKRATRSMFGKLIGYWQMKVVKPSEWRRIKKNWQETRTV